MNSYESLFGELTDEGESTDLFIKELHDFKEHPFRVTDDEDMLELIQSIKEKGILVPLTVRPIAEGGYEIMSDEDAVDIMIYSNIQRTNVLPSEKANAYKLQMETMRHQGKKGLSTPDAVGKKYGDNARKVQRYIRLTYLIPDLLELVDKRKLSMQAGYWISFLDEPEQNWILKTYQLYGKLPKD